MAGKCCHVSESERAIYLHAVPNLIIVKEAVDGYTCTCVNKNKHCPETDCLIQYLEFIKLSLYRNCVSQRTILFKF